VVVANEI